MASQKEFKAARNKLNKNVTNVAKSIEELKLQVGQISQTLQPQIAALETALSQNKSQMARLEDKLSALDSTKIDKEKMDVALKLEMLKIKQTLKSQLGELQSRLKSVENKVAKQAAAPPARKVPSPPPQPTSAAPVAPTPGPAAPAPGATPSPTPSPGELEEQTIEK
jgi:uncharacterized phage infection (PIP) family protein YhgE